jgi:murein DD-endopeptidase MepM/ murein hydrolase activator NlpD
MASDNMPTLPFGIPNPFAGGDSAAAPTPAAQPLTLAQITAELPEGVTIYQVTTHDSTGKTITDKAAAPTYQLQPGDAIELRGNGKQWLTHVNADASDIEAPTVINQGGTAAKTPQQLADDAAATARGRQSVTQPAADAKLVAQARAGLAAAQAGKTPTQSQLDAYEQVKADPALTAQLLSGGGGTQDSLTWIKNQLDAGHGTQGFGSGSQWNNHEQGQDINVPFGTKVPLVTGTVTAVEDWGYGDHAVVIQRPDGSEVTIGHIQAPDVKVGDTVTAADSVLSGGAKSPISSGPQVEVRIKPPGGGAYVDPAKFVQGAGGALPDITLPGPKPTIHSVAPGDTVVDDQGNVLYTAPAKATLHSVAAGSSLVDDNGNVRYTAPQTELQRLQIQKAQQDLLPKAQLTLSQQYDTLKYIHQQLAAGNINPADATGFYASVKAQTQAALAGTTPFEIFKQQQDFEDKQATNAKALLDTQVTASGTMVDSLLKSLEPDAKVPPLVRSSVPFDINPVLDVAQQNIQRYIPAGLTSGAQQLLSTFYGDQPPAPGQTDASGMPLHPTDIAQLPVAGEPAGTGGVQDFEGGPIGTGGVPQPNIPDQQAA